MDKAYRKMFAKAVSRKIAAAFPGFGAVKLQRTEPEYDRYSGSLLFSRATRDGRKLWILFEPEEGVSRRFFVSLGWTVTAEGTPLGFADDDRLLDAAEPICGIRGGWLGLEQVEGNNSSSGFLIPSPWDAMVSLPLSAPKTAERALLMECDRAAEALTALQREESVSTAVEHALSRLQAEMPRFELAVQRLRPL